MNEWMKQNKWMKQTWMIHNEWNERINETNKWMNEWMSSRANVERTNEWMKRMKRMNEWSNWHCSFCTHCSFAYKTLLYMYHDVCILFENEMNESYSKMKWMNEWTNEMWHCGYEWMWLRKSCQETKSRAGRQPELWIVCTSTTTTSGTWADETVL